MSAEFVAHMEDVLDLYAQPYDPRRPVVCFDETSTQLLADTRPPLPAQPGRPARQDYEYRREGTRNLFLTCEPMAIQESVGDGWITSEESRDMNRLRDIRNPYAHFRPPWDETSIEVSALSRGSSPYEIAESDAAAVILVVLGILDKTADHHSLNR